jgi:hypothetical protein
MEVMMRLGNSEVKDMDKFNEEENVYFVSGDNVRHGTVVATVDSSVVVTKNDGRRAIILEEDVFFRQENALHALALIKALEELREKDWNQHMADIGEAREFQNAKDAKVREVIEIATEYIGHGPVEFSEESLRQMSVNAGIPISRFGVLNLGNVAIVPSESRGDTYYPVTENGCGCPSFAFRKGGKTGRCKHMHEYFPLRE